MADWLVIGAGIGGLAAALALQRQGIACEVWEKSAQFHATGAGIQLGPNSTRILYQWGLRDALNRVAVCPTDIACHDAQSGQQLGALNLGDMSQRYRAPYLCLNRADLHHILHQAIDPGCVNLIQGQALIDIQLQPAQGRVMVANDRGQSRSTKALIGADGLWSQVRLQHWQDGPPMVTGHWAYRATLAIDTLPPYLHQPKIQLWIAPGLHVVYYPTRSGQDLNLVLIVQTGKAHGIHGWDSLRSAEQTRAELRPALRGLCSPLLDLLDRVSDWRVWSLAVRPPLHAAAGMARGPIALLGDAAHPMLPYLAQGAGMAIEDAWQLGHCATVANKTDPAQIFHAYAMARWQRNAKAQSRSRRNGYIFHARGPVASLRNLALRTASRQFMDQPWLYAEGKPT